MEVFTDYKAVRAWSLGRQMCKIEDRMKSTCFPCCTDHCPERRAGPCWGVIFKALGIIIIPCP